MMKGPIPGNMLVTYLSSPQAKKPGQIPYSVSLLREKVFCVSFLDTWGLQRSSHLPNPLVLIAQKVAEVRDGFDGHHHLPNLLVIS